VTLTDTQIRAHAHALAYRRRCLGAVKAPATDLRAYAAKCWLNCRSVPPGSRDEWVEAWLRAWDSDARPGRRRNGTAHEEHLSVRVPKNVRAAYEARARERGVSLTRVVREVLEEAL